MTSFLRRPQKEQVIVDIGKRSWIGTVLLQERPETPECWHSHAQNGAWYQKKPLDGGAFDLLVIDTGLEPVLLP